jgi:hypothetical protein
VSAIKMNASVATHVHTLISSRCPWCASMVRSRPDAS